MTMIRGSRAELLRIVQMVRTRWRFRQVLQGLAVLAVAVVAFLWISGAGLEQWRFSPTAIVAFRVLGLGMIGFLLVRSILPLFRRVTDEQVALYLEEHEPQLGQSLLSAVSKDVFDQATQGSLAESIVKQAVARCRSVDEGRRVERGGIRRAGGILTAAAIAALITILYGPPYLRHSASAMFFPTVSAEDANPYSIAVEPGDITISRGSDLTVAAELQGFTSSDVTLFRRVEEGGTFEAVPMIDTDSTGFEALLFQVDEPTEYFVESTGIRSGTYRVDVADLPYVDLLTLVYHFPSYTGLPPQTVEGAGDIAVLSGTRVEVLATPTLPTPAGAVVFGDSSRVELAPGEDGVLTGSFDVSAPGIYGIELTTDGGLAVAGSPEYAIDVLEDQPPTIVIREPGRDTRASSIEEVYVEVEGRDDYGVGALELLYMVNGGEEQTVQIFTGSRPLQEASAGYTFFLEDLELDPGDVVAYYARVTDNNRVGGRQSVESDIYMLQIRSFLKDYTQADQQGGGGGGGGGAGMEAELSEQQRQVIAGTFNVQRDRERYSSDEYSENVVTVSLAQQRLIAQVEELISQMQMRGISGADEGFRIILEELPKAVEQMKIAVDTLDAMNPSGALPAEQRALQHLLRAEEAYRDVQVAMGQQGGGGGGGGSAAEDLADLFELELDKMKNQYETVQRQAQQQVQQEVDEELEKLKELARRQEQEAERQRRRAAAGQSSSGGSDSERELAEMAEEASRRLERLARENQRQDLAETAERLQEAAQAMRRSAGSQGNASAQQAREALERLRDARRLLEQSQSERAGRTAEDALRRTEDLMRQQEEVQEEVQDLVLAQDDRAERVRRLADRKQAMESALQDMERELDRAGLEASRDAEQRDAASALKEAADWIRDSKLKEKVRYTNGVIQQRPDQTTRPLEEEIESDLSGTPRPAQASGGGSGGRRPG